jgi:hypothetical protein
MNKATGSLKVFFEEPFWVGLFEREEAGSYTACRIVFGAEPKDYEIWQFILKNYYKLIFSPGIDSQAKIKGHVNPKRRQREVKKQLEDVGNGTKSQQALKLWQEQKKAEKKNVHAKRREEEKQKLFELKQQKKKEKHKGR